MNRCCAERPVALLLAVLLGGGSAIARADAGVLIPWNVSHQPDPKILSLQRLDATVRIDHLHARVDLTAVFKNHSAQVIEGRYVLPLGERASIEDFSVWQGEERLVGVIVEKRRGRRLFEQVVRQQIDPGLAERDDDPDHAHDFAVRVAPIPPHGTARVEVTFSEELPVTSRGALFTLPWKPRRYGAQRVAQLHVDIAGEGPWPLAGLAIRPQRGLAFRPPHRPGDIRFAAVLDEQDVQLGEDLTIEMRLGEGGTASEVLTFRDPASDGRRDISPFGDGTVYRDRRGFLMLRTLFSLGAAKAARRPPRDVVLLLDTSLSMQWEKLERAFAALEYFLGRLDPGDRFDLVTFNDEVRVFRPQLVAQSSAEVQAALAFVRGSYLAGGSDLGAGLAAALALAGRAPRPDAERFVVLISDGQPTLGEIGYRQLGEAFQRANQPDPKRAPTARLFALGVGDDAATTLLARLASAGDGSFAWAREGSEADFKLRTFFDKLGQASLRDVALTIDGLAGIEQVYPPVAAAVFDGSDATFFARYQQAGSGTARVHGVRGGQPIEATLPITLPARDTARPWVARGWARLRIGDLLDRIAVDGEKEEWLRELVALAKEFHLVTPYTSFIAAPRALLRPRVIQPGDPVLRVKAAPDITRVAVIFPFGLQKALRYLPSEEVWETRFLAPVWMRDGTYTCQLVLTDRAGHKIAEAKRFVIDSRPPEISARLDPGSAVAGKSVAIEVRADADTRRVTARLGDGPASDVVWDPDRRRSLGVLPIPADTPTGRYTVTITAADMAHNVASTQLALDVVGSR